MKKLASKVAKPAQIQPNSQFLFHKNLPPRDFSIMTLIVQSLNSHWTVIEQHQGVIEHSSYSHQISTRQSSHNACSVISLFTISDINFHIFNGLQNKHNIKLVLHTQRFKKGYKFSLTWFHKQNTH
jgi:hypothetical protein